jgi:hypothetical protein
MDKTIGAEGFGAEQAVSVDGGQFLKPDSALVQTALHLLTTHVVDTEGESTTLCAHCGLFYPCPTVQHARQVVNAGGLAKLPVKSSVKSPVKSLTESPAEPADHTDAGATPARAEADDAGHADADDRLRDPVAAV